MLHTTTKSRARNLLSNDQARHKQATYGATPLQWMMVHAVGVLSRTLKSPQTG